MSIPTLSICVPSRNRQVYFQETIKSLLVSERDDVEFVLADNSDDPSIMNGFMQAFAGDRRIRYLRSAKTTLSMMDNWERALAAATGRFVAFIGDDDYIDPGLAGFIVNLEGKIGGNFDPIRNRSREPKAGDFYHYTVTQRSRHVNPPDPCSRETEALETQLWTRP